MGALSYAHTLGSAQGSWHGPGSPPDKPIMLRSACGVGLAREQEVQEGCRQPYWLR